LNASVDSFFVMAYDMEYSNYYHSPTNLRRFCLGPTSPLTSYYSTTPTSSAQYSPAVTPRKVIFWGPYYGRKLALRNATAQYSIRSAPVSSDTYLDAAGEADRLRPFFLARMSGTATPKTGLEKSGGYLYSTTLKCTRQLFWDDAVSLGYKYDLANRAGLRGVGIWTLNYGGGAKELWSALGNHFGGWRASYDMKQGADQLGGWTATDLRSDVTNTGGATWPAAGHTRVDLNLHFATLAGVGQGGLLGEQQHLLVAGRPGSRRQHDPDRHSYGALTDWRTRARSRDDQRASVLVQAVGAHQDRPWRLRVVRELRHEPGADRLDAASESVLPDHSHQTPAMSRGRLPATTGWTLTCISRPRWRLGEAGLLAYQPGLFTPRRSRAWKECGHHRGRKAPPRAGSMYLEAEMLKEHKFWFKQYKAISVIAAPPGWSAAYSITNVPTTWVVGKAQTFSVTVTNNGTLTWPSTGYTQVDLYVHFATSAGGAANRATWLASSRRQAPQERRARPERGCHPDDRSASIGLAVLELEMVKCISSGSCSTPQSR